MTKKELIYEIQKAEAKAWKDFQASNAVWGRGDDQTIRRLAEWRTLYNLREALGIHPMPIDQLITEDLLPA